MFDDLLHFIEINDAPDAYSQCKAVDPYFQYDFDALKCFKVVKNRHVLIVPELKNSCFGVSYSRFNKYTPFLYLRSHDNMPERLISEFLKKTIDYSIDFSIEPCQEN